MQMKSGFDYSTIALKTKNVIYPLAWGLSCSCTLELGFWRIDEGCSFGMISILFSEVSILKIGTIPYFVSESKLL